MQVSPWTSELNKNGSGKRAAADLPGEEKMPGKSRFFDGKRAASDWLPSLGSGVVGIYRRFFSREKKFFPFPEIILPFSETEYL